MEWSEARERLREPIFAPLGAALARLPPDRWPSLDELNAAAAGVATSQGKPVRFVAPRESAERLYYETRIAATGEVETRDRNWHDLFNALAWISYPRAKAAINAQHATLLAERGEREARRRGPERDALTLFDEGGIAVATRDRDLTRLIVDFEWKELFWRRRGQLARDAAFFAFGHALLEKALDPFVGIVAKTAFLDVDAAFFALDANARIARVDELLAAHFSERSRFPSPRAMAPMPVLGVPGWHRAQDEAFYDDPVHFRSKGGTRKM
jgi:DUF3025 family protein